MPLNIPNSISVNVEAHTKWLTIINDAQTLLDNDVDFQNAAARGLCLKERKLPPEVLGRFYAQYCVLVNKLYDAYLNSVHLQRAPYMMELVTVFLKRLYELRNELVHVIVNDYIYVDTALIQQHLTPMDIQIVVPFHFPSEARKDTMEQMLQKMWADAVRRKRKRESPPPPVVRKSRTFHVDDSLQALDEPLDEELIEVESDFDTEESVHTIIPEEYVHVVNIQKLERFRLFYNKDFRAKCIHRKTYFGQKGVVEVSIEMKTLAARLIQRVFREYMKIKRQHYMESKKDIILGLIPDSFKQKLNFEEENNKIYKHRREIRSKIQTQYLEEMEKENMRIMMFTKNKQMDDITEQIREWFKECTSYEIEGGTILVIRGDYNTIEEQIEQDEKLAAATKGKTPEMIKSEKKQAKAAAKLKEETDKVQEKKQAEQLMKLRCNPFEDPGYQPQQSECLKNVVETFRTYRSCWSIYDKLPPHKCADTIYGYLKTILTEDLMCQLHKECRKIVDDLMRIDLKLLIEAHQLMYSLVGWKYPKQKARKKPKKPPVPKPLVVDDDLQKKFEELFDMGIITKPTAKLKDIIGDFNYAASDLNIRDPDAKFPLPAYGDIKRRLVLSCIFASGIEPGARRNKAVMLVGPARNGKSFLVDAVAGELNAIKIDITPKEFSAKLDNPAKVLNQVFLAARAFQPAVIYMRNVEKVFCNKVAPEDRYLNAKSMKVALPKLLKSLPVGDQVIFIATCSDPLSAQAALMASIFNEIILVPRTDYGTLQQFLYHKLQRIKSMPRDYCVQPIAQILQGYGFGVIVEAYNNIMTPERIVKLNVNQLSPIEFIDTLLDGETEPLSVEDYQVYVNFFLDNSPLSKERKEYENINAYRAVAYEKMGKAMKKKAK